MPITRASEIGNYLYCRRAWWYQRQGLISENLPEMTAGTELHRRHGLTVLTATLARLVGFILLFLALILLITFFIQYSF